MAQDSSSVYSQVVGLMDKILNGVQGNIFGYAQAVWQSALSQALIAISMCVFVYMKIAGGNEWSRHDFQQIGTWLIIYIFLTAIFHNYSYYYSFVEVLGLPIDYLYQGIKSGGGMATLDLNKGVDDSIKFLGSIFQGISWENDSLDVFITKYIIGIITFFVLFIFVIFLMIFTILIKFMASLILSLCPLFIPCLIIKQFRGYFFSWLKLYASIALQAPFAFLIGGVILNGATAFTGGNLDMGKDTISVCNALIVPIIIALIGIAALSKIPVWTQQLIGSGDGGNSTGLKAAAAGAGAIGGKMAGKTLEGKAKGASLGKSMLAGAVAALIPFGGEKLANNMIKSSAKNQKQKRKQESKNAVSDNGKMEAKPTPHQPN